MDYNKLQVIDFLIKGNTIKLILGCPDKNGDWTNHDWSAEWTSYRPEASTLIMETIGMIALMSTTPDPSMNGLRKGNH